MPPNMTPMTHRRLRNSQLIAFDNAAAGHHGVLSDRSGEMVVKPCKDPEITFYQSAAAHPEFAHYIPTFMGILSLTQSATEAGTPLAPPGEARPIPSHAAESLLTPEAWIPSNGARIATDSAIVLENVASGLKKPNILDVKLGARLWADDAPPEKRLRLDKVAAETTSRPLGFRIAGMKTWMGDNSVQDNLDQYRYKVYDKGFGRSMTVDTIRQGFADYFFVESVGVTKELAHRVISRFLDDLRGLRDAVEREESRMYSASLLFVYEGDGAALAKDFATDEEMRHAVEHALPAAAEANGDDDNGSNKSNEEALDSEDEGSRIPKIQAVKVIDFAHAAWTPGQGPDENFLHGVRNVMKILEELIEL